MIWKINASSKWLILSGIFLLGLFAALSSLIRPSNYLDFFGELILVILLMYLIVRSLDVILNPVFLSLDNDGVYLRGKIFVPYKDVLAFTKERRLFPSGGYIDIYNLFLQPSTTLTPRKILLKTKFFLISYQDRNNVIRVVFPSSYTTAPSYEEVLGEMFEKYRNKTGDVLSSNYYPDLYKERTL